LLPDRSERFRSGASRAQTLHHRRHLTLEYSEVRAVRRPPSPKHDVEMDPGPLQPWERDLTPDLTETSLHKIAVHNAMAMLGNDESESGMRNGRSCEKDVQVLRPLSLPPFKQSTDLRTEPNARLSPETFAP